MIDVDQVTVMTVAIASAYVANNKVMVGEIPQLISTIRGALTAAEPVAEVVKQEPAVPIKQSIKKDHIVCLEDGKKLKMLKRHLKTAYNMTPDEYRKKWGLPTDYPMTAPGYSETRSGLAKEAGLGRKAKS